MTSCFKLPSNDDYTRVINFSGGRSSGYLLYHILKAHDGKLPNSVVVVFCNTGKEHPETLDFVKDCGENWNVPIVWLEFDYNAQARGGIKDPKHVHRVVDYETASRNGEPFTSLIDARKLLPNAVMRKCTSELKVLTADRYIRRDLGWRTKRNKSVLGIRADEPRRLNKALLEECLVEYPLALAGVTREMVDAFWDEQPFDLDMDSAYSNCDACFLKGQGFLTRLFRKEPALADWWIEAENKTLDWGHNKLSTFHKKWTYKSLLDRAMNEPEFPLMQDEQQISCFCTD